MENKWENAMGPLISRGSRRDTALRLNVGENVAYNATEGF